ncbi:MAG: hypothetical protein EWV89_14735 [Microcystis wesenbergii Mw_QC_B_20070930_S4]|jgi:hypothetical protein|nr:MAG: hypothetical protein EWV74_00830 [Microcystis wesenbergii Mw_QC_S_20081001_S30]TRV11519.1 MAG: hypothetical protein EWV89_14735 [Microcystis wesenbergii Mw_QC_B_20070930_S4]
MMSEYPTRKKNSLKAKGLVNAYLISSLIFLYVLFTFEVAVQVAQQLNLTPQLKIAIMILMSSAIAIVVGYLVYRIESIIHQQYGQGIKWLRLDLVKATEYENKDINVDLKLPKELVDLASHWIEVNNVFAEERKQLLEKISELQQEEKLLQEQVKKLETALQKSVDTPVYTITGNESTANDYSEDQVSQFIAKMQRDFESETHSVVCLTSSTPEEINSYKEQLEYRVSWLQVLLEEAEKELKLLYILFTY